VVREQRACAAALCRSRLHAAQRQLQRRNLCRQPADALRQLLSVGRLRVLMPQLLLLLRAPIHAHTTQLRSERCGSLPRRVRRLRCRVRHALCGAAARL
jgi:hypothetical protein